MWVKNIFFFENQVCFTHVEYLYVFDIYFNLFNYLDLNNTQHKSCEDRVVGFDRKENAIFFYITPSPVKVQFIYFSKFLLLFILPAVIGMSNNVMKL